jgi:hypothetical protein
MFVLVRAARLSLRRCVMRVQLGMYTHYSLAFIIARDHPFVLRDSLA